MLSRFAPALAVASALSTLALDPGLARACGGCFAPPGTISTVDAHRMVISLSPTQTTLWDQIRYSGNPDEFVWVLPVPSSDTKIALANDAFFTQLENQTAPVVSWGGSYPNRSCPYYGGQYAGGADGSVAADAGVTVFQESVVGPYETVTVGSDDPAALHTWLTDHNYNVPPEAEPVIAYYVQQKSVFIALRLRPGQGVSAMQPVRVTYSGFMGSFPLKMVTIGAQGALSLELFVIADQRYDAQNYGTRTIPRDQLVWDWQTYSTNYAGLFTATIEAGGGRAFIAEAAQSFETLSFFTPFYPPVLDDSGAPPATVEADVAVARTGLRTAYLTRLRTRILLEHLGDDLVLAPAADATNVSRFYVARREINRPKDIDLLTCPKDPGNPYPNPWGVGAVSSNGNGSASGGSVGVGGAAGALPIVGFLGLALLCVRRRRRR